MKRNPRGRAVIINNKIFHGPVQKIDGKNRVMLAMREGTDEDVQGLHKLFTDLHFHVKIHKDKNAQVLYKLEFITEKKMGLSCFTICLSLLF